MIDLYIGKPGCGKTTTLTQMAFKAIKLKECSAVFSNAQLDFTSLKDGYKYHLIRYEDIGRFDPGPGSLLLIDEGTIVFDSRKSKDFDRTEFFCMARHFKCEIAIFTQQFGSGGIDKRIRELSDRTFWVKRSFLPGFSRCIKIPYNLSFPEDTGEILMGYRRPSLLATVTSPLVFRRKYYKYFDSYVKPDLPSWEIYCNRYSYLVSSEARYYAEWERKHKKQTERRRPK